MIRCLSETRSRRVSDPNNGMLLNSRLLSDKCGNSKAGGSFLSISVKGSFKRKNRIFFCVHFNSRLRTHPPVLLNFRGR